MKDVSIVLVNYNACALCVGAIKSISEKSDGFSYETIVVDNSNNPSELSKLKESLKQYGTKVIDARGNVGFGAANNIGANRAEGKYLFFLNNDTLLVNNAIYELFKFMEEHNDVGVVGSNLYNKENQPTHSFIPVEKNIAFEKKYESIRGHIKYVSRGKRFDFNYSDTPLEIHGYCCGAAFMMKKEDFDKLGGFDKDIFMYGEESLLEYRLIHELNKKIYNIPSSKIIHFEGSSYDSFSERRIKEVALGTSTYYRKAFGLEEAIKYLKFHYKNFKRKRFLSALLLKRKLSKQFKIKAQIYLSQLKIEEGKLKMKVLVTGVRGQLGYDCVKELTKRGYKNVLGIDINELDITDEKAVHKFINEYKPDVVMHNAAWTAVDKAEEMKDLVYKVNALGPKYIAEACKEVGAKMVYISTDYVFDGKGDKPFEVDSPKVGLSTYGRTKAQGEDFVISSLDKYFIVRISWVFGINGNNFVKTMLKLADNGKKELNVVSDQIGSVTYTPDLARLLVDMIETDKYGIYHATNEGYISWADFAKEIFALANKDVKVNYVTTEEYKKLVPNQTDRPLNSRLSKKSLDDAGFRRLPDWKDALERYLKEIKEN